MIDIIDFELLPLGLILILLIASVGIGYAILQYFYHIHSVGNIQTISVQIKDDNGNILTSIDWGTLTPNSTKNFHVFAINNGTVPITLNLLTENWNPTNASNFISLSWDYLGDTINPGMQHPIIFTLTVNPDVSNISSFSFDIVIQAQEV
ncbi:MAG: hypothetical protein ACPLYF_00495 [Fervidobacterium sp.]